MPTLISSRQAQIRPPIYPLKVARTAIAGPAYPAYPSRRTKAFQPGSRAGWKDKQYYYTGDKNQSDEADPEVYQHLVCTWRMRVESA